MERKKQKWLFYTCIVGALPILIRWFLMILMKEKSFDTAFVPIDFIFFGLTLSISNFNEINAERLECKKQDFNQFFTIMIIIFLAVDLGCLYFQDITTSSLLDINALKITSIFLSLTSLGFSYKLINC
ncbi:hypothetical protein [Segatella copri]|uniref:hypothetical protein n=1 Tax=Segatella copri TaxID=165179 RepID=UPI001290CF64|nr:hypothetical protein [Segatella copri]MQN17673.1 hypothetical protein [Segatella copri]MQN20777.1 hypothetical protein [Segatella copri]